MSSFQKLDDEEIEQSQMKTKLDLITVTSDINLDTLTTITSTQSDKVDFLTVTGAVNLDTIANDVSINNAKVGITSQQSLDIQANNLKTGITNTQASQITQNESAITSIEDKTDHITITQPITFSGNEFIYNDANFIAGSAPGNQLLIQHADLNNGSLSPSFCSMRITDNGELRLNVPSGQNFEFRINNVFQYNNTQIKNLVDNLTVSNSVNLNTMDSDITGIKNNSLASTLKTLVDSNTNKLSNVTVTQAVDLDTMETSIANNTFVISAIGADLNSLRNLTYACPLKTAVDLNTAKTGITSQQASDILTNNAKVGISQTQINAINDNTAKITSAWTVNGQSEIHRNSNVGIKNSDPNSDLEIGAGTSNVRVRLNGQNGQAISSEIIFSDGFTTANAEYFNGAAIRFNSSQNRLEFLTDQGDDNSPEAAIYIVRATSPYVTMTDLFASNISVNSCNLKPHSIYCYGRRVRTSTDTDNNIELSTSDTEIIYNNILTNGITYNTSTGFFSVSVTGIYHVVATLQIDCGTGAESQLQLTLKNGTTNVLKARTHVSRAESNNNTAMQFNMNAPVRLASGLNYNFTVNSKNNGTGVIQNDLVTNNSLMIKGLVIENSTTIPSDWGESNT